MQGGVRRVRTPRLEPSSLNPAVGEFETSTITVEPLCFEDDWCAFGGSLQRQQGEQSLSAGPVNCTIGSGIQILDPAGHLT